jgi:hypothetical protein
MVKAKLKISVREQRRTLEECFGCMQTKETGTYDCVLTQNSNKSVHTHIVACNEQCVKTYICRSHGLKMDNLSSR